MITGSDWMRVVTAVAVAVSLCVASVPVSAQEDTTTTTTSSTAGGGFITTSTTLGVITTIGGGIALTVLLVNNSSDSKEAFIRQNAIALQQDMTLGGGEAVEDLAAVFQIEDRNLERFGKMVRNRRANLMPLTDVDKLNDERADRFFGLIADGMQQNPHLRSELHEIAYPI